MPFKPNPINTLEELRAKCYEDENGCWLLKNREKKSSDSRPSINFRGKYMIASRAALIMAHGDIGSRLACHKCANQECVRPHADHVYAGTHKQNAQDMREMIMSGRQRNHWAAYKMFRQQVKEMMGGAHAVA